jgi:serine/threonine-protein kinase
MDPEKADGTLFRVGPYGLLRFTVGTVRLGIVITAGGSDLGMLGVLKRVISPRLPASARFQLRRSLSLTALRLKHDAIARTLEAREIDGEVYFLQEFVHGVNLVQLEAAVTARQPFPIPIAVHIVREVSRALAYAHTAGDASVAHGDLTPENIIVSYAGDVKVIDFGGAAARAANSESSAAVPRRLHLAPELLRGQGADALSDIYALGALLWRLLSSRPAPHAAPRDGPMSPSVLNPDVPPALEAVFLSAVAPDRARRYQTAAALHEALAPFEPAGYDGRRVLASLLAARFPVEDDREALAESVRKAREQLIPKFSHAGAQPFLRFRRDEDLGCLSSVIIIVGTTLALGGALLSSCC